MSEQEAWHDWSKSTWLDSVQRAWADELQEYYRNEDWRELDVSDLYPLLEKADARIRELEAALKTARQEALEEAAKMCEGGIDFDWSRSVLQTAAIKIRALCNEAPAKGKTHGE